MHSLLAIALMCCTLFIISCTTDYNLEVKDYDTALTLYNKSADFASYKYFLMPDTIVHIVPEGGTDEISRKYDAVAIQNIISNFQARGYVRILDTVTNKPDFVVVLTAYSSTYVGYYYDYWSYWGWYYPYYPPGWGYYPPGGAVYSYTTGTLVVSMIDPLKNDPAGKKVLPVWWGHITGLLGDTYSSSQTRILNALDQLFTQSPYMISGR
jgi:hypothetical protein